MNGARRGHAADEGDAPESPGFLARPPESIAGKPLEEFTPEDEAAFDAWVEGLWDALSGKE